jgi:hypothetical protein
VTRPERAVPQSMAPDDGTTPAVAVHPRPDLRKVPVELLGAMGWMSGIVHVPVHQTLLEFFALAPRLVKLTRVRLPQEQDPRPFVALQREAITLVAPSLDSGVAPAEDRAYSAQRSVACLLASGVLRGHLAVLLNMRLSDHLQQHGPLIVVRHSLLTPYGHTAKSPGARSFNTVIVNLNAVLGVSEDT